ncbi:MAG: pyridoxamine 5'-phosphate oxidase family protein [Saprospiraceae bacterium]|nr:pyridoxamine 5'-phosphate oxidase family protein [Saprospiraceae bacterium]
MPKPAPKKILPEEVLAVALQVVQEDRFPVLATVDGIHARVRPVSPVHIDGFTTYVANLRSYAKTKQIEINPCVELCYLDAQHNQVRIEARAEVVTDRALLEFFWKKNRLLEHYLGSIDNPELIVYRMVPTKVSFMQEWALTYMQVDLEA